MKLHAHPHVFGNTDMQSLLSRRNSGLLPDEPRDISVPAELQGEDRSIPLSPVPSWVVGAGVALFLLVGWAIWAYVKYQIQSTT